VNNQRDIVLKLEKCLGDHFSEMNTNKTFQFKLICHNFFRLCHDIP